MQAVQLFGSIFEAMGTYLAMLRAQGPAGYAAIGAAAAALLFLIQGGLASRKCRRLLEEVGTLKSELEKFRAGPQKWEYRIERFDVLWFPTLTTSPSSREITQATAGVPHCPTCVRPLTTAGGDGQWSCPKCGAQHAGTLADLSVMDIVNKQAIRFFQERHPDYTLGKGIAGQKK